MPLLACYFSTDDKSKRNTIIRDASFLDHRPESLEYFFFILGKLLVWGCKLWCLACEGGVEVRAVDIASDHGNKRWLDLTPHKLVKVDASKERVRHDVTAVLGAPSKAMVRVLGQQPAHDALRVRSRVNGNCM
jgi:hypothetical protein